ncbi:MAG: tetratricopeptide repeat protein, partial [Desulfobacterales bacterium]|nr:tetratricopeptide repeat protein [Desulfobacterales bacterium]
MTDPQGSEEFIAEQKMMLKDDDAECANSSYNRGVALMEAEKLDEAIDAFKDAIED